MFRALLLDFDDTLVDSFPGRCLAIRHAVQQNIGIDITQEEVSQALLRCSNVEELMEYLAPGDGLGPKLVRSFREHYYGEKREPPRLFSGVREVLRELSGHGVVLSLVTSRFRHHEEDGLRWGVLQELEALGISGLFAVVVGYEDTQAHKPHPAPFQRCLELLDLQPQNVIAVGDSPLDIQAAHRAAIPSAAALWGTLDKEALLAAGPDMVLEQPQDILAQVR